MYLGGSITEGAFCEPLKGINMHGQAYDYTAMEDAVKAIRKDEKK